MTGEIREEVAGPREAVGLGPMPVVNVGAIGPLLPYTTLVPPATLGH